MTAIPMEGDHGVVTVMIEPARAADLTPILLEACGLTEREIDIVIHLARGPATKEIAAELSISPPNRPRPRQSHLHQDWLLHPR